MKWSNVTRIQSSNPRGSPLRTFVAWAFPIFIIILFSAAELGGQDNPNEPKPLRIDITPLVGYRSSVTFPTTQDFQAQGTSIVLSEKPSYGFGVGLRLNEEDLVEVRWARQASDIHFSDNNLDSTKVVLHQVHLDCTHEFIMDTWPMWVRPYVIGSVGGTHINGMGNSAFTRFSFGLGTGLKVYVSRHVGLRFQVEWLPIVISPDVAAFVCGAGCIVHLSATAVSQGEIVVGPVFRF
jgi:hypothetical protein